MPSSNTSRDRVRAHRARLRAQGLRPVQFWLPDVDSPEFIAEAHRQSLALAQSPGEAADQAFIDAITEPWDSGAARSGWRPPPETTPANPGPLSSSRPITTVNRVRLSRRSGRMSRSQIVLLDRAIATFLGIAGGPPPATEEQEL